MDDSRPSPSSPSPPPSPLRVAESDLDAPLSTAEFLTRQEVLKLRSRRAKQLARCYKAHYWALMEELKDKHKEYYWLYGKSPYKEEDEEENEAGNEGNCRKREVAGGNEEEVLKTIEIRRCEVTGCKAKAMALTKYCHAHILSDSKQKLYKGCSYCIKSEFDDSDSNIALVDADHELSIQESYNDLCKEVVKLKKVNKKLYNKLTAVENEKNNLLETLKISEVEILRLKTQKDVLDKELRSCQECQQKSATQKLDEMLSSQKSSCDRTGLGYATSQDKDTQASSFAVTTFESIVFVKGSQIVDAPKEATSKSNHCEKPHKRSTSKKLNRYKFGDEIHRCSRCWRMSWTPIWKNSDHC